VIKLLYTDDFLTEVSWLKKHNRRLLKKISLLCDAVAINPSDGIGKPEKLLGSAGLWSRRIDKKNRLIYEILDEEQVKMISCKDHYDDH
jgi:toxin YoeB